MSRDSKNEEPIVFPWYYVTRFLGVLIVLYGVFGDKTPERSTIIVTGAGLIGLDRVANKAKSDDDE